MASPLTSPTTIGEHQIEAVQKLLVHMGPESIKDYAKAREALGKDGLAYRLKAIKELPHEVLAMVIQTAQMRPSTQAISSAHTQAQPTEATSLKRPRPDTDASETATTTITTTPKPAWQLDLPYLAASCNKSHKCKELWVREGHFRNHFGQRHLLSTTNFKAQDGSSGWVCDPETCKKTFAKASDFTAHIWTRHMRVVSRQQSGHSQAFVGPSGYSPASHSIPHTPGDEPTFSPQPTAFLPAAPNTPIAMTPNATISHPTSFTTPAPVQPHLEGQSLVPFGTQPVSAFPGNGYLHAMHRNNNTLYGMPYNNPLHDSNSQTVVSSNNVTHNKVAQNAPPASAHGNMTSWPDQLFTATFSPSPADVQLHSAHTDLDSNDLTILNADPSFR